jgi:hypothetical protein
MTSRTIDIKCHACRNYLFSLQPDDYENMSTDYYCDDNEDCQRQATIDKLKKKPDDRDD